ncbi:MAG: hypothetical protein U9Q27_01935 [Patescibacteria group bacterium]|nr:hypothetical protein [Patescibacteria group bacterium]
MKYTDRNTITIFKEDISYTFLKPFSGEHLNKLIVICEDAYGDFISSIMNNEAIHEKYNIDKTTIKDIFNKLI